MPYYLQLYRHIAEEIRSGGLASGEKLPSKRALAQHLSVSINTVDTALPNAGDRGLSASGCPKAVSMCARCPSCRPLRRCQAGTGLFRRRNPPAGSDCSTGSVDTSVFPFATWARLTKGTSVHEPQLLAPMEMPRGICACARLCAAISTNSGACAACPSRCCWARGMEYLLMVLCSLLPEQTLYAVEEPGYRKSLAGPWKTAAGPWCICRWDQGGLSIRALEESGAQCAYVTPSHQYPHRRGDARRPPGGAAPLGAGTRGPFFGGGRLRQ